MGCARDWQTAWERGYLLSGSVHKLDSGLWTGPWTGLWTGLWTGIWTASWTRSIGALVRMRTAILHAHCVVVVMASLGDRCSLSPLIIISSASESDESDGGIQESLLLPITPEKKVFSPSKR